MDDERIEADRAALDDSLVLNDLLVLAKTKKGVTATSLETRVDLAKMILRELDILTKIAPGRRLGKFLDRVLSNVATWARGQAIEKLDEVERNDDKMFEPDEHPSFQTAAAGELLGFVDEKMRERVRRKYYSYEPEWLERFNHKDYRRTLGRRRLYAGVWIGGQHPVHVRRPEKQRELLGVFESAIKEYLTDEQVRAELKSVAMELVGDAVSQGRHYVRRERYHIEFRSLLEANEKLIAIVGEPGNGKSELATGLIQEQRVDSNSLITIRADSNSALLLSLVGELTRHGIDCDNADPDQLKSKMAALIAKPSALDFVLIDNLDESVSLDDLLPPIQSAVVIVTARVNPLLDRRHGAVMQVKTMEEIEAEALLHNLMPRSSAEDRAELRALLKGHPLAIVHACGFIGDDDLISVKGFCEQLRQDAHALNVPLPPAQYTLIAAYSQILSALRQRDVVAARLLELVAFVDSSAIPLDLMRESLTITSSTTGGNQAVLVSFEQAVRILQARYLIDVTREGLTIHSLTQHILRALLRAYELDRCLLLHDIITRRLPSQALPAPFLDNNALAWIPHLYKVLRGLTGLRSSQLQEHRIGHSLSLMIQGMRQMGDLELAHVLMNELSIVISPDKMGNLQEEGEIDYFLIAMGEELYRVGLAPRNAYSLYHKFSICRQYGGKSYNGKTTEGWEGMLLAAKGLLVDYKFREVVKLYEFMRVDELHVPLADSPPARGALLTACGVALMTQGIWVYAAEAFAKGAEVYQANLSDPVRARGMIELITDLISIMIELRPAISLDLVMGNVQYAHELLKGPELRIRDPLLEARFYHAIARFGTAEFLRAKVPSDTLNEDMDECGYCFAMADELYRKAGASLSRYNMDRVCDSACYELLLLGTSSKESFRSVTESIQFVVERANELAETDLLLHCQLMLSKMRLIRGRYRRRDINRCLRIAWRYRDRCQMPVAYADAVTTAYVTAFLTGHKRESSLLYEAAKRACFAVAKGARLEAIRNSLHSSEFNPLDLLAP